MTTSNTTVGTLNKATLRKVKRVNEIRNQLENLRKEFVAENTLTTAKSDSILNTDQELKYLVTLIERGV